MLHPRAPIGPYPSGVQVVQAPVRPAVVELVGWTALGAIVGLVVFVFQPLLSIALAVGLPVAAIGTAWAGHPGPPPRSAYVLGAFGVGLLGMHAVVLAALAL
jgi:hypothetical protein